MLFYQYLQFEKPYFNRFFQELFFYYRFNIQLSDLSQFKSQFNIAKIVQKLTQKYKKTFSSFCCSIRLKINSIPIQFDQSGIQLQNRFVVETHFYSSNKNQLELRKQFQFGFWIEITLFQQKRQNKCQIQHFLISFKQIQNAILFDRHFQETLQVIYWIGVIQNVKLMNSYCLLHYKINNMKYDFSVYFRLSSSENRLNKKLRFLMGFSTEKKIFRED
ncbi:unnamed protein product [Paramecium sonneborni]|uniref:Uncharacterized protein n=1 Tax=Paramecium sonneborni TaxID=65129 RepID=A0A8S1NWT1_9CILI|nr:unnamed protein product [Paramecium sonneborni]